MMDLEKFTALHQYIRAQAGLDYIGYLGYLIRTDNKVVALVSEELYTRLFENRSQATELLMNSMIDKGKAPALI